MFLVGCRDSVAFRVAIYRDGHKSFIFHSARVQSSPMNRYPDAWLQQPWAVTAGLLDEASRAGEVKKAVIGGVSPLRWSNGSAALEMKRLGEGAHGQVWRLDACYWTPVTELFFFSG
jgi:hypothetical protein